MKAFNSTTKLSSLEKGIALACSPAITVSCNEYIYVSDTYMQELLKEIAERDNSDTYKETIKKYWGYASSINKKGTPLFLYGKLILDIKENDYYVVLVKTLKELNLYKDNTVVEEESKVSFNENDELSNINSELDDILGNDLEFEDEEIPDIDTTPIETEVPSTVEKTNADISDDFSDIMEVEDNNSLEDLQDVVSEWKEDTKTNSERIPEQEYIEDENIFDSPTYLSDNFDDLDFELDPTLAADTLPEPSSLIDDIENDLEEEPLDFSNIDEEINKPDSPLNALYPTITEREILEGKTSFDDMLDTYDIESNVMGTTSEDRDFPYEELSNESNQVSTHTTDDLRLTTFGQEDYRDMNVTEEPLSKVNIVEVSPIVTKEYDSMVSDNIVSELATELPLEFIHDCLLSPLNIIKESIHYHNKSLFKMIDTEMQDNIIQSIVDNLSAEKLRELITNEFINVYRGDKL